MSTIEQKTFPSYEFGPFVLNGTERMLLRGGDVVPLMPRVFETLFVLVENHGRVVTKDVLMETLWPDAFVAESSLTQNISLLRKALGNGQADQVYIETIPKRGYRFVAKVREVIAEGVRSDAGAQVIPDEAPQLENGATAVAASADSHESRKFQKARRLLKWQTVAALVCVFALSAGLFYWWRLRTAPRQQGFALKSVAVLPFKTVGAADEAELLGLGMADSVILKLNRIGQLTILPTSSVFKFLGERDALAVGYELGVDAVLDGTVQRSGDQVRVTAQLITLKDGKTIWSGQFDEKYRDIFCLQDSVSGQLASELRLQVLSLHAKSESRPITQNAEAYQAYVNGLYFWNIRSRETLPKAIDSLEQAVTKDGNFALAYALLADCYHVSPGILKSNEEETKTARQKAEAAAIRALELDETLAEAHTVMAGILANRGDGDGASTEFRRALILNPSYATAHVRYAHFLFALLDPDGAVREARQAQVLDPLSPVANGALGYMLLMNREWEESIPYLQRSLELNPDASQHRLNLGLAYLYAGHSNQAVAEFSRVASQDPVASKLNLALTSARLGRRDEAHKLIGEVLRSAHRDQLSNYQLVTIYFALGKNERAFGLLRKSTLSWTEKALLKLDPALDKVRSEAKFQAIVKQQTYPGPRSNTIQTGSRSDMSKKGLPERKQRAV